MTQVVIRWKHAREIIISLQFLFKAFRFQMDCSLEAISTKCKRLMSNNENVSLLLEQITIQI